MHQDCCHNELDWTAFCYAAGELTPGESEAFEARLADDQDAREALARAVELGHCVAAAESLEPAEVWSSHSVRRHSASGASGPQWARRLTWMAIGSAASLLVAALVAGSGVLPRLMEQFGGQDNIVAIDNTGELATAWSETRRELAGTSEAGLWYLDHLDSTASEPDLLADEREENALAGTPSWMTAALRGSAGLPVDGDATPFDSDTREN